MTAHRLAGCLSLLVVATSPSTGDARVVLLGGRSAAMSMATVASGEDGAMPYLNPAGLAGASNDTLSISANLYLHQRLAHRRWFAPGDPRSELGELQHTDPDRNSSIFQGLPTSAGYMLHLGDSGERWHQVIALSLLVPDSERRSSLDDFDYLSRGGIINLGGRGKLAQFRASDLYLFGGSYAVELTPYLRVGASAFYAHDRLSETVESSNIDFLGTGEDFTNSDASIGVSAISHGLLFELGAQLELPWLRLGLALQPPSIHLDGDYRRSSKVTRVALATAGATQIVQEETRGEYTVNHPLALRLGAALTLRRVTVEAAMTLLAGADAGTETRGTLRRLQVAQLAPAVGTAEEVATEVKKRTVVNAALGVEVEINPTLSLRGGAYTDLDRTPSLPDTLQADDLGVERIDFVGSTLGVSYGGPAGRTEFGVGFAYGFGEAATLNTFAEAGQPPVAVDLEAYNLMFFLSGALSIDEI